MTKSVSDASMRLLWLCPLVRSVPEHHFDLRAYEQPRPLCTYPVREGTSSQMFHPGTVPGLNGLPFRSAAAVPTRSPGEMFAAINQQKIIRIVRARLAIVAGERSKDLLR